MTQAAPVRRETETSLNTEQAGRLDDGDEFKFQPGGFNTSWQVFTFRGVVYSPSGIPSVSCYGGDPNPKGDRAWRAFQVERIVSEAQPPGAMARKKERV
jgi:hypothetical protein